MQEDRFTTKAQEAVAGAQRLASGASNPEVAPAHLLLALLEQDSSIAELRHGLHLMRDEQDRPARLAEILHAAEAASLELRVSHCQHLVNDKNFAFEMCCYSKSKPHIHPPTVALDWGIQEFFNSGKINDLVKLAPNF